MLLGLMSRWMMPFLMGVLHGLADGNEQLQSLAGRQVLLVTELRHRESH